MRKQASVGRRRGHFERGRFDWVGLGRSPLRYGAIGLALALGPIVATPSGVAAIPCAETPVIVTATDANDARVACRGAVDAISFLAERGFRVGEPVVVAVVEGIDVVPGASVLGIYDPKGDVVQVLARSVFSSGTTGDTVLGLPVDDTLYASIFAHEVAHAVIYRNIRHREISSAAHEYLAYAVQLATLPPSYRERILARFPGGGFTDLEEVSEVVLGFDSDRFAVKAYRHFRELDDQDAVLGTLLAHLPTRDTEWY
jgi:hypothetical protein